MESPEGVREVLVLKDWERGGSLIRWDGGHDIRLVHPEAPQDALIDGR